MIWVKLPIPPCGAGGYSLQTKQICRRLNTLRSFYSNITYRRVDSKEKPRYFSTFYGRRFLRIIPLYFTVITLCFLVYRQPAAYFGLSYAFLANFATAWGVSVPHGPGVFWSLAIEEHFYLIWPLIIRFLSHRNILIVCVIVFLGSPFLRGIAMSYGQEPERDIYFRSWFRFDGLTLGALLALWFRSSKRSRKTSLQLAGLMLTASVLILIIGAPFGILGTKTLASTSLRYTHMQLMFGSAILASLALAGSPVTALLRTSFMRVSSDLSYCVYLIHVSIGDGYFWFLKHYGVDMTAMAGARRAWLFQCFAIISVTFGLAYLSKKYMEDPFLRLKSHFNYK